jgi:hypothetical protein
LWPLIYQRKVSATKLKVPIRAPTRIVSETMMKYAKLKFNTDVYYYYYYYYYYYFGFPMFSRETYSHLTEHSLGKAGPGQRAGRSGILILAGATGSGAHPVLFMWYQGSFPRGGGGLEWSGRGVNHSPPSSAEVKNEWNCTSFRAIRLYGVDREIYYFR